MTATSLVVALALSFSAAPLIEIEGNVVLTDDVYRAAIDLDEAADLSDTTAQDISFRVLSFLTRAGYELATVAAEVRGDRVVVRVDEGKLDKIIFPRLGVFNTLLLQLEVALPRKVFNRPELDRQLDALKEKHDYVDLYYRLIPVANVLHEGPQLPDVDVVGSIDVIPDQGRYELHIFVEQAQWRNGFGVDLSFRSPDGLGVGLKYSQGGLLFNDDRWQARLHVAARIEDLIAGSEGRQFISNVGAGYTYWLPRIVGTLRPQLILRGRYLNRQRKDLGLIGYNYIKIDPILSLTYLFDRGVQLGAGAGVDHNLLIDTDDDEVVQPRVDPPERVRPFIRFDTDIVLDPDNPRRDRLHRMELAVRHYFDTAADPSTTILDFKYQLVIENGWDEARVYARAGAAFGYIAFTDEFGVSDHVRGIPGDRFFTRKVGSAAFEYRVSLSRDDYKVSVFDDVAVYAEEGVREPRVANGIGAGFHALFLDSFQFSFWAAVAWTSDNDFHQGAYLAIQEAF